MLPPNGPSPEPPRKPALPAGAVRLGGGCAVDPRALAFTFAASHLVGVGDEEAILIADHSSRSQADNREACLVRLKTLVSMAAKRPKVRRATKPTRGSKERRIEAKKREGEKKRDRRWSE